MEKLIYYCPICGGKVLVEETINPRPEGVGEPGEPSKLYCPHCEMLVVPLAASLATAQAAGTIRGTDAAIENRGRSREGGTNAGGAQRGDLSDQGAAQWRPDPREVERNTWQDKD
jgi:hypothetical protein